jgi:hypothetical protein
MLTKKYIAISPMKKHIRLLILGSILAVFSKASAEQNPYAELHQNEMNVPEKLKMVVKFQGEPKVIPFTTFGVEKHNSMVSRGYVQIGMYSFKAPPNAGEEKEARLQAKRIGAEIVYVKEGGKDPYRHFALFYATAKPEFMTQEMRKLRGEN